MLSGTPNPASDPRRTRRPPSGAAAAHFLLSQRRVIVAAYVFLLAAGRILGSEEYGSLAALLGLLAIVLIPAGALQMAVSREVSRRAASGDASGAAGSPGECCAVPRSQRRRLVVAIPLAIPVAHLLHIHSVGVVVVAVLSLSTALVFPVSMGVLQGQQRFPAWRPCMCSRGSSAS